VIERAKRQPQSRSAIIVRNDGSFSEFVPVAWIDSHKSRVPEAAVATPQVVVDPNAAIRAAGLTEAFAQTYQLSTMHGPSGFLPPWSRLRPWDESSGGESVTIASCARFFANAARILRPSRFAALIWTQHNCTSVTEPVASSP
jgi:hypothetical protein